MKRGLTLIVLLIATNVIFSQTITKIDENGLLMGSKYFPLFSGAKWDWTLDMFGNKTDFSWEISGVYKINDKNNNLNGVNGFLTVCKELDTSWYFIEDNGFISFYEKIDKDYTITKFFPTNPKMGDSWQSNFRLNKISTVTEDFVKVEIESEDKATIGYRLFRKEIGLYDLFEIEKTKTDEITTKWTLNEYVTAQSKNLSFNNNNNSENIAYIEEEDKTDSNIKVNDNKTDDTKSDFVEKKIIKETDEIIKSIDIINNEISNFDKYFITTLKKNKTYIQIGSFSVLTNAINFFLDKGKYGYSMSILKDKDGFYKILIEVDGNGEQHMLQIRKDVEKNAFFKQK